MAPPLFRPLPSGRGTKPMDLTGRKVGLLTVLGCIGRHQRTSEILWLCRCDCGGMKEATTRGLHRQHTISCGCIRHRGLIPGNNKKDYGEARFNDPYRQYQRSAASRGHSFGLSKEEFRTLTKGDCHYCGAAPAQIIKASNGVNGEYVYNGVDRIDNSIGYHTGNGRSCCKICNVAKASQTEAEFFAWIDRVYARRAS